MSRVGFCDFWSLCVKFTSCACFLRSRLKLIPHCNVKSIKYLFQTFIYVPVFVLLGSATGEKIEISYAKDFILGEN